MNTLKKYIDKRISIAKMSFLEIVAFRISIFSIIISTSLLIILSFFLWTSIYSHNNILGSYDYIEMITYVILSVLMNSVLNTPRRMPVNISRDVRSGQIGQKINKPINYYEMNFWYCIGRGFYFLLVVAMPIGIIVFIFLDVNPPKDILHLLSFIISFGMGYMIELGISMILAGLVFWTVQSNSVIGLNVFFSYLLSGRLIPIELFPYWLKNIANILPYRGIVSIPISIYLGKGDLIQLLIIQVFWTIALIILGNWIFKKAHVRLEVVGG